MSDEPRKGCMCAAYGCPLVGTMTPSTTGSQDWLCWLHFGRDATHWQAITVELNRVRFIADALTSLRSVYGTKHWPDAVRAARQALRENQRNDLTPAKDEPARMWMGRIDHELQTIMQKAGQQQELPVVPDHAPDWTSVDAMVPA
jgi:hypothetical protein